VGIGSAMFVVRRTVRCPLRTIGIHGVTTATIVAG
jgi:hypothetical protein